MIDRLLPAERLLYSGASTCAGTFECHPGDPLFHAESPSTAHCLVFSRTPVWIRHERGMRYVADPTVATFHNRGRVYQRWAIAREGDRCDWIAYADDLVADAVSRFRPGRRGRDPRWFPAEFSRVSSRVYARQRRFFERLHAATIDSLGVEEEALLLLDEALTAAAAPAAAATSPRHFDAVQHARAVIASAPDASPSLRMLARGAGTTPFHLCRAFSRVFGETMTTYRTRLRLLASLERVRAGDPLTDIALSQGFSSHSHFTASFRAAFGMTPRVWRARAGGWRRT